MVILFYLPLAGMHGRLVHEKAVLMEEVGNRIKMILKEIHEATFEEKDFEGMGARVAVHSVLLMEKDAIENLSAWLWQPGTFRWLLSALLLPIVLSILRDAIIGLIGF